MSDCPCGAQVAPNLLACPACHRLVHLERLKSLKSEAQAAEARGDETAALGLWREALTQLPADGEAFAAVSRRAEELARRVDASGAPKRAGPSSLPPALAGLGMLGLAIWKLKGALVLLLGEGKFFALGLANAGSAATMMASWGVYATAWGWRFALGLVLCLYVHEMGHVWAIRRFGLNASAPMFVPGVGAYVRLKMAPAGPRQDARIGLAGPTAGLAAAVVCAALGAVWQKPLFLALARSGAWLNLFNLAPLGPLDGGRGVRSIGRGGRWLVLAAFVASWRITGDGLPLFLALATVPAALAPAPETSDSLAAAWFLALIAALTAVFKYAPTWGL
jgi:Zn-dependent protease